jgi:hypothetical protein
MGVVRSELCRHASSTWPALAALGAGALAAIVWSTLSTAAPLRAGRASFAAADRDRREVVLLDESLFVLRRVPTTFPVRAAGRADRSLWIAGAESPGPLAPHLLRRIDVHGSVLSEVSIGPLLDLDVLDGGDALVVELSNGARRALRVDAAGALVATVQAADLACIAGRADRLLIGADTGRLDLCDAASGAALHTRAFGGIIADVDVGPRAGTWWVLDAHGGPNARRVALIASDLSTLWSRPAGVAAIQLTAVPRAERVWLVDASAGLARRFGPGGAVEIAPTQLSMFGAERGRARADGSVLFAAPGAILALDAQGQPAPGQGGFDYLVDLCELEAR